jgi:Ca2+-binding RTX toxin-like protein
MTTYTFATGTSVSFNPATDVLNFSSTSVSAADLQFQQSGTSLQVGINNQFITLLNVSLATLLSSNLSFASGSVYRNGSAGNDTLAGGTGVSSYNDYFDISKGGNDSVVAGNGNDLILAGGALNAADTIDGGTGTDTLRIQGNYASAVVFTATTVTGVENFVIGTGGTVRLTVGNGIFTGLTSAPVFDASSQVAGDGLVLDASAVTVGAVAPFGAIRATGGLAADTLTGGAGYDTLTGG